MLTLKQIKEKFSDLSSENLPAFLECFKDDLKYTATGTAGRFCGTYNSRNELFQKIYAPIIACLAGPMSAEVTNVCVCGEWAVIELTATGPTKNGKIYRQEMCWVCRYEGDQIAEMRYYGDTAATERLLNENS